MRRAALLTLLLATASPVWAQEKQKDGAPKGDHREQMKAEHHLISAAGEQAMPEFCTIMAAPGFPALEQRYAGRLIGGLAGGGIGYMASRKDGRSWAVPLGALLGTQMGCPLAQGRGPLSLFGL